MAVVEVKVGDETHNVYVRDDSEDQEAEARASLQQAWPDLFKDGENE